MFSHIYDIHYLGGEYHEPQENAADIIKAFTRLLSKESKEKDYEQRMKDKIKELETTVPMAGWGITEANKIRLAVIKAFKDLLVSKEKKSYMGITEQDIDRGLVRIGTLESNKEKEKEE